MEAANSLLAITVVTSPLHSLTVNGALFTLWAVAVEKVTSAEMIFPGCGWTLGFLFCLWSVLLRRLRGESDLELG